MIVTTERDGFRIFSCVVCKKTSGPTHGKRWQHICRAKPDGCKFLGDPLEGESVTCDGSCHGGKQTHQVFACAIHGKCVFTVKLGIPTEPPVANCRNCADYLMGESQ